MERREYPRSQMALDVAFGPVASAKTRPTASALQRTVTINISLKGVCIYSDVRYPIGGTLFCAVSVPGHTKPIQASGPLVWFQKTDQQGHWYRLGIEFSEMSGEHQATLQQLLAHPPVAHASRAKKLLLVDDDEELRLALKLRFEASGFQVVTAREGLEGLRKGREEHPHLIILDLMLPQLNGYEVCRLLKFDQKYRHIPVILCTARSRREDMEMGRAVGADAYLTKPFDGKILIEKVEELLKQARPA